MGCFVAQFSKSVEYRSQGIDVQCQIPLLVSTKMTSGVFGEKRSSLTMPDSDTYARAAIWCIGYDQISMPTMGHFLLWCSLNLMPDFFTSSLVLKLILKHRESMRRRRERNNISTTAD